MAEKKEATVSTQEINPALEKAKGFWANYSKPIIYAGSAIIILFIGWMGYQKFIRQPKIDKANETIFLAEGIFDKMATAGFSKDSVNIVLNGGNLDGENITGLLKVISSYDGTPAANRAKYMVGASYLHIGEFDKAIKYLKDFDGSGAAQVQSKAYTMLGHAYSEKKQVSEALSYYEKAAEVNQKDESITPDALMMAASYADAMGKTKEAIGLYKKLKDKFPAYVTVSSGEVDKHLARLGEFN
jgi:tetratricopeptide (TPR) repeat protein